MTSYRYYWLLAAAGIAVLFAFQPDWSEWRRDEPVAARQPTADASSARLAIQDLELVSLERGQLALGLDAELFWVRPRKYLFYQVSEENELYVEGARLQIHLAAESAAASAAAGVGATGFGVADLPGDQPSPQVSPDAGLLPPATVSPLLSKLGLAQILKGFPEVDAVSQINVRGISVEVFQGMRRVLVLTAESAVSDNASRGLRFNQVRLEKPAAGRVLIAPMALWSGPQRQLQLPQGYQEIGPWGTVQGGPATLGGSLEVIPVLPE